MNPLISYQYEPGSVMKVFSFASAIEEGKYNVEETFKSGSYTLDDGTVIRDSERKGWGTISFDEGFARSSNVAATTLALRLGVDTLSEYYNNLGFGKKQELNFPMKPSAILKWFINQNLQQHLWPRGKCYSHSNASSPKCHD